MSDLVEKVARLKKRVETWKHNSDSARVTVNLGDLRAAIAAMPRLEGETDEWRDIASAPKNTRVLVAYQNRLGKWRIVVGCYHTQLPWSDDHWFDDAEETEFAPAGWYEESETHETVMRVDGDPSHWMPLPDPPASAPSKEESADTESLIDAFDNGDPDCEGCYGMGLQADGETPCPCTSALGKQQGEDHD